MPRTARLVHRLAYLLAAVLFAVMSMLGQLAARASSDSFNVYVPIVLVVPASSRSSMAEQVVELTNQQRRQNGCNVALTLSPQLSASAYAHSEDMALHNIFGHNGSDGSTMVSRIEQTGYSYSQIAENIAAGQSTPQDVVAGWMGSAGHRENILNCSLREIGIGYYDQPDDQANVQLEGGKQGGPYRYYWTQDFGTH